MNYDYIPTSILPLCGEEVLDSYFLILYSIFMFLTPHATVAIAITQSTGNPLLAFIVGFVSHYLLDLIPHGDEALNAWILKMKFTRVRMLFIIASIDVLIAGLFLLYFWATLPYFDPWIAFWAALGAVMPDVLWGLAELRPGIRILEFHKQKHHLWQEMVSDTLSLFWGSAVQLATLIVSVWFILGR